MRAFAVTLTFSLLQHQAFGLEPDANSRLVAAARSIDLQAQQSLGISISQVALLLQAGPNGYAPKWSLEKSGSWPLLQELESKGFVKITVSGKLPDGTYTGEQLVSYVATPKGQAVVSAIKGK